MLKTITVAVAASLFALAAPPAQAADITTATLWVQGEVRLGSEAAEFCTLAPTIASPQWQFATATPASWKQEGNTRRFLLKSGGATLTGLATIAAKQGAAEATWKFTADKAVNFAALVVTSHLPIKTTAGGSWTADGKSGTFPAEVGPTLLYSGPVRELKLSLPARGTLDIRFPEPTAVLLQDDREWGGSTFSLRIGRQGGKLAAGESYTLPMTLASSVPMQVSAQSSVAIAAGKDWLPLKTELDIVPDSALDLSHLGFADAPCGKFGRLGATPEGHFAFEKAPTTPRRFYGVNLCFDAQYLPKEQVDRLCDRLLRLGYNALRIHHYERQLTAGKPGFDWNPQALDQLDYLLFACHQRGIYVTTDLFVSRPVSPEQVQMPAGSNIEFKILVPVHEPAMKDWQAFSRKLLEHVNPYTKLRWADDPALAWLSLINEGNIGNYWKDVKAVPQWSAAWNRWLVGRYGSRAQLLKSWGDELKASEDPAAGTVALPQNVYGATPRHRDVYVFIAQTEHDMFARMKKFLRDEIRCQAMLTNMNAWTDHLPNQLARDLFDYVDDHFYVDHPHFLEQPWRLPSSCPNSNPISEGAPGGRGLAAVRLFGKPFTVSEYNYSGPGRFRGVGGILTGAMGALQDWDVIWRFAYSHTSRTLFAPGAMNYFDLASDPLNQAADRAAVMLYLRGDMQPAPHQAALVLQRRDLLNPPLKVPTLGSGSAWLASITRFGTLLVDDAAAVPAGVVKLGWPSATSGPAFSDPKPQVLAALRGQKVLAPTNRTDPEQNIFESETGQMLVDGPRSLMRFDTARTAGGYADPGQDIACPVAGVSVRKLSTGATLFVTSIDGKPIRESRRLLVTHLTDLQNTDATYAEPARQTLLAWGKLPHLVRAGTAEVELSLSEPQAYRIYALSTGGRRVGEVKALAAGNGLSFTCNTAGPDGAVLAYEVVRP